LKKEYYCNEKQNNAHFEQPIFETKLLFIDTFRFAVETKKITFVIYF